MEPSEIKKLLKKYWGGKSSLEEEKILKEYFDNNPRVDSSLVSAKELFNYYSLTKGTETDLEFVPPSLFANKKHASLAWLNRPVVKIAASLLLILGLVFIVQKNIEREGQVELTAQETYEDPELAYAEVKKALQLISHKLNKGKKEMTKLSRMNKANKILKD